MSAIDSLRDGSGYKPMHVDRPISSLESYRAPHRLRNAIIASSLSIAAIGATIWEEANFGNLNRYAHFFPEAFEIVTKRATIEQIEASMMLGDKNAAKLNYLVKNDKRLRARGGLPIRNIPINEIQPPRNETLMGRLAPGTPINDAMVWGNGEAIFFRLADGRVGFVNDPSFLEAAPPK